MMVPKQDVYDVIICGGGLAGLSLAIQLKQSRPQTSILIIEKWNHPAPEAAFKVGESTVEIGAHYFKNVINMSDHLAERQLPKQGLRFYFPAGDNTDIARRVEFGQIRKSILPAFQLDRGRFENALAEKAVELKAEFIDGCKVRQVKHEDNQYAVSLQKENAISTVHARWVVDASGRPGILKRQFGLSKKVDHAVNAVWFRIGTKIDIDHFSDNPEWRGVVPPDLRWAATNHLMGRGYWVWLIPLASNSTSVGIVADPDIHPFDTINKFELALQWLEQHEPQCAAAVKANVDLLQDFRVLKHFSNSCERVFSADRWCMSGEAGVFLDPFYSPGSDFISMSNTFITDLITRDLAGEDIAFRAEQFNQLYLSLFEGFLLTYEFQYPIWGNPQVMTAKVTWDYLAYWAFTALLFFQKKLCDLEFVASIRPILQEFYKLGADMQVFFREWDHLDQTQETDIFIDSYAIRFLYDLHNGLVASHTDESLYETLQQNLRLAREVARQIIDRAAERCPTALWRETQLYKDLEGYCSSEYVAMSLAQIWLDTLITQSAS